MGILKKGVWLACSCATLVGLGAGYTDSLITASKDSVVRHVVGDDVTYVFTGTEAEGCVVRLNETARPRVVSRYLVVGGGGAGGWLGGGGGAGGVVTATPALPISELDVAEITVGAGGTVPSESGWKRGLNGGESRLVFNGTLVAHGLGGAGGSGWGQDSANPQKDQLKGDYGSGGGTANGGSPVTAAGTTYQGNPGGRSYTNWQYAGGGGGGGQGGAGGNSTSSVAGAGGAGIVDDITGVEVEYAAGGGGGAVNNCTSAGAAGGVSAGAGGEKNAVAGSAPDGFGGGGGGGSYSPTKSPGKGGSGTVALRLSPLTTGALVVRQTKDSLGGTLSPAQGLYAFAPDAARTFSAEGFSDVDGVRTPTGYTLETWDETLGAWGAPQEFAGATYNHIQSGTAVTRLTWKWSVSHDYHGVLAEGTEVYVNLRTLTLTLPPVITSRVDYAAYVSTYNVTNIVIRGPGVNVEGNSMLVAQSLPNYEGDFTVTQGAFLRGTVANMFGRNYPSYLTGKGTVTVRDGGGLWISTGSAGDVTGKRFLLAGKGPHGNDTLWDQRPYSTFQNCHFKLMDDIALANRSGSQCFVSGGNVHDLNGHTETIDTTGTAWSTTNWGNDIFENSSDTPASLILAKSQWNQQFIHGPTTFRGGAQNRVVFQGGYCYRVQQPFYGDWTLVLKSCYYCYSRDHNRQSGVDHSYTNNICELPVQIDGVVNFWDDSYRAEGAATSFSGPISGSGTMSVGRGDALNIFSHVNSFSGTFNMYVCTNTLANTTVHLWKDSAFSAAKVVVTTHGKANATVNPYTQCDFLMDEETVFALPAFENAVACGLLISGGAAGSTVASVTQNKAAGFTALATPARIPLVRLAAGTLDLPSATALPSIGRLVCGSGVTVATHGNTIEVDTLEGIPTATGGGRIVVKQALAVAPGTVIGDLPAISYERVHVAAASLAAGTHVAFYAQNGADLSKVTAALGAGLYADFSAAVETEGAYAGYTRVDIVVSSTPPESAFTLDLPAAPGTETPVAVPANVSLLSGTVATGSGVDWLAPFGYRISGTGAVTLAADPLTLAFGSGQNTVDVPLVGLGTLNVDTALYPYTNAANAVYAKTRLTQRTLENVMGTVAVNTTGAMLRGPTTLETASFAGKLVLGGGETHVDSLDFVRAPEDLTFSGNATMVYGGPSITLPGFVFKPADGFAVATTNDIGIRSMSCPSGEKGIFKHGPGALKLLGTGNYAFKGRGQSPVGNNFGFSTYTGGAGNPLSTNPSSINIADGAFEVGVVGDATAAPTVKVAGAGQFESGGYSSGVVLNSTHQPTVHSKLVVNNGSLEIDGALSCNFWSQPEAEGTSHEVEVNGGSLTALALDNRMGWGWWPKASQSYTVNGGVFTVRDYFNLTQLSPRDNIAAGADRERLRESAARRCTVNGGEMNVGSFRMAYAFGRSWNHPTTLPSDRNGYGHGWQANAYLTVNGGTLTVKDYLLTADRTDSYSWTILNGGTLKVNMITNTFGKAATTHLVLNGGTLAPTGDGDNADELVLKDCFTDALVSTNGAIVDTSFIPGDKVYTIAQVLSHDASCGEVDGGLVKRGSGTLALAGANTFTGDTRVEEGTLAYADEAVLPARLVLTPEGRIAKTGDLGRSSRMMAFDLAGAEVPMGTEYELGTVSGALRCTQIPVVNGIREKLGLKLRLSGNVLTGTLQVVSGSLLVFR